MRVIDDLSRAAGSRETILTIGAFDGVHRGHQVLIRTVVERARATGRLAALITFHPHPAFVLASQRPGGVQPFYLTTPGEKLVLLEGLGVDLVAVLPFDRKLADTSARDFMGAVAGTLRPRELWVGPDFALGHRLEGDAPRLRQLGAELGYELFVLRPVVEVANAKTTVSSSRIRALLREGQVEQAAEMLGRPFSVSGEVVAGAHRGRGLGFPTANLEVRAERVLPADGVYAVYAVLGEDRHAAVANVGVRPSFDNGPRTVETHILGFSDPIYGCDLEVQFIARLREERRFDSPGQLSAQIARDIEAARELLRASPSERAEAPGDPGSARRVSSTACTFWSEEVEHTADRALRVWGKELADLFSGAARGMYRLMANLDNLSTTRWREIHLDALDRETLLVAWLNELLFITESEGLLFTEFRCRSVSETALEAWAGGTPGVITGAHIKAATFHALDVAHDGTGWSTLVTFDT